MSQIKVLQFGGGSMGTRRMRDLSARKDVAVALVDFREDRRKRAQDRFSLPTFATLEEGLNWQPQAMSISTPPDTHAELVNVALDRGLHHFCEANIWTNDAERLETISAQKSLVSAPSNSMIFLPSTREIRRIVLEELGNLHAYQMMLSTFQPGWHPGEGMEFYARHRHTAAAREMVPFELLWLNHAFGKPAKACGSVTRRGSIENTQEDIWAGQFQLENGALAQLTVLMGCPAEMRRGRFVGDNGSVDFDLMSGEIVRNLIPQKISDRRLCGGTTSPGVLEEAYREEIHTFIDAIQGKATWPEPYNSSAIATAALASLEQSAVTGQWVSIDRNKQPARLPDEYTVN
jgi:predicted dehydrogenase